MNIQEAIEIIEKERDKNCDILALIPERAKAKCTELNKLIAAQSLAVMALVKMQESEGKE